MSTSNKLTGLSGRLLSFFQKAAPEPVPDHLKYLDAVINDPEFSRGEMILVTGFNGEQGEPVFRRKGMMGRVKDKEELRHEIAKALGQGEEIGSITLYRPLDESRSAYTEVKTIKLALWDAEYELNQDTPQVAQG